MRAHRILIAGLDGKPHLDTVVVSVPNYFVPGKWLVVLLVEGSFELIVNVDSQTFYLDTLK